MAARIDRPTGLSALVVTHDQTEAMAMSDRSFCSIGKIAQQGTPEDMYKPAADPVHREFMGSNNHLPASERGR